MQIVQIPSESEFPSRKAYERFCEFAADVNKNNADLQVLLQAQPADNAEIDELDKRLALNAGRLRKILAEYLQPFNPGDDIDQATDLLETLHDLRSAGEQLEVYIQNNRDELDNAMRLFSRLFAIKEVEGAPVGGDGWETKTFVDE